MRKLILLATILVSGLISAGLAEQGLWLPAIAASSYNLFVLWANIKGKPRRAGRGKKGMTFDSYSTARVEGCQEERRYA